MGGFAVNRKSADFSRAGHIGKLSAPDFPHTRPRTPNSLHAESHTSSGTTALNRLNAWTVGRLPTPPVMPTRCPLLLPTLRCLSAPVEG